MRTETRPIITVTPNTALDEVLMVTQVQKLKRTFDTTQRLIFPSGKGINVARAISLLGGCVEAFGMVGKESAHHFEEGLAQRGLRPALLKVNGVTRMNTTLCDTNRGAVIHIRREPLDVNEKEFKLFEKEVEKAIREDSIVVFGGTLPRGIDGRHFAKFIRRCEKRNVLTVVDSSGAGLKAALSAKPFMIKPNVEELADLVGRPLDPRNSEALLNAMDQVASFGIELVVVSRGSMGLLVKYREQIWSGRVKVDGLPAVTGAIGSGDATVAGFCLGLARRYDMPEIIRLAVACGAANVLSIGPAVVKKQDVRRLRSCVAIREIRVR